MRREPQMGRTSFKHDSAKYSRYYIRFGYDIDMVSTGRMLVLDCVSSDNKRWTWSGSIHRLDWTGLDWVG